MLNAYYDNLAAKLFSKLRGVNMDANMINPEVLSVYREAVEMIVDDFLDQMDIHEELDIEDEVDEFEPEALSDKYNIGCEDIKECECGCDCEEDHMMLNLIFDDLHGLWLDHEARIAALEARSEAECTNDCCRENEGFKDVIKSLYLNTTEATGKRKLDSTDGKTYDF